MSDIDWTAWHRDGHKLLCGVSLFTFQSGTTQGQLDGSVECPPESVCRRHFAGNPGEFKCFIDNEIEAMSFWDFIEALVTDGLPEDWRSDFPIEIEWQDQGEDGICWRPRDTARAA